MGVFAEVATIELFFTSFDRDRDHKLHFCELASAFIPEDPYSSAVINRRETNHGRINPCMRDDLFNRETAQKLKDLLRTHLSVEASMEAARQRISRN